MTTLVKELFTECKISEINRVSWGTVVNNKNEGIYIISTSSEPDKNYGISNTPDYNDHEIEMWINKLSNFQIDKIEVSFESLKRRLSQFWLSDENILYIGKAPKRKNGDAIGNRLKEYYDTKIGDRSPHSGGQWVKVLKNLSSLYVYFGNCKYPGKIELKMFDYFMNNISQKSLENLYYPKLPLPFANIRYKLGMDKKTGLKNQRKSR